MRAKRLAGVVGALAVGALALAACTSEGTDGSAPEASDAVSTPATVTHDDLPLLAYTPTATEAEAVNLMRKQQELLFQCMTDRGFEFEPTFDLPESTPAPGADLDMKSKEFAETYGYGVFNNPFGASGPVNALLGAAPETENPNEAYYESLEPERQEAYMEALNGGMGCLNQANDAVYGANPWDAEEFRPLVNGMKSVYSKTQSDPKTAELNQAWVACMADAGYAGLKTPSSAHESFTAEFGTLQQQFAADNPPVRGQEIPTFDLQSPAAQEALARELAQAKTDWECRNSIDYDHEMLRTQYKHEQAFVSENEAELEAFRDALAAWRQP